MAAPGTTEPRTAPASPEALRQELAAFRSSHPLRRLKVEGIEWEYLLGGSGPASVVLLPGGLGVGDIYFRLFTRLDLIPREAGYEQARAAFMGVLPPEPVLYNEYHALIVAHGKERCTTRPLCAGCPLQALCVGGSRTHA